MKSYAFQWFAFVLSCIARCPLSVVRVAGLDQAAAVFQRISVALVIRELLLGALRDRVTALTPSLADVLGMARTQLAEQLTGPATWLEYGHRGVAKEEELAHVAVAMDAMAQYGGSTNQCTCCNSLL